MIGLVRNFEHDAERAVIAGVLMDGPAAVAILAQVGVTWRDMADPRHQVLFAATSQLCAIGRPLDPVTIGAYLDQRGALEKAGGREYLGGLYDEIPHAGNLRAHAKMVLAAARAKGGRDDRVQQDEQAAQVGDAQRFLDLEAGDFLRLPWARLDAAWGGLMPGTLSFLAGHPGGGKTSFLLSLITRLVAQKKRVLYAGLETRPNILRTQVACRVLGLDPGPILSGDAQAHPEWPARRAALKRELERQREDACYTDYLRFSGHETLDAGASAQLMADGKDFGADLVIVDHIDHVRGDGRMPAYAESRAIVQILDTQSKNAGLRTLASTQTNNEGEAMDPFVPHRPMSPKQVYMGKHKEQVAHWFLYVYRPLRPGLDREALALVRDGHTQIRDVLAPYATAVGSLKNRPRGEKKGEIVTLGFLRGEVLDDVPPIVREWDETPVEAEP